MGAKLSFELDAGKILAKLHRGACQSVPKVAFFNTGIVDDADIEPEQVDGADINFDLDGGKYELGVVIMPEIKVNYPVTKEGNADIDDGESYLGIPKRHATHNVVRYVVKVFGPEHRLVKSLAEVTDAEWRAAEGALEAGIDETAWKTLFHHFELEAQASNAAPDFDDFKEDIQERAKKLIARGLKKQLTKNDTEEPGGAEAKGAADAGKAADKEAEKKDKETPITENPDGHAPDRRGPVYEAEIRAYQQTDPDKTSRHGPDVEAMLAVLNPEVDDIGEIAKDAPEAAKKALQKNHDAVKKFFEEWTDTATGYLKQYMTVFAGKDQAAKIHNTDVKVTRIPDGYENPYKNKTYERYQIPAMTDEAVRQDKIEQLKKNPDAESYTFYNLCFKIGYDINLGK